MFKTIFERKYALCQNRKLKEPPLQEVVRIQEFLDMIALSVVKFNADHFICDNTYRCVWALREYTTTTDYDKKEKHTCVRSPP